MLKLDRHRIATSILLAALPAAGTAQEAADVLAPVAEALRLDAVSGFRFVAAGSGYDAVEVEDAGATETAQDDAPTETAGDDAGPDAGAADASTDPEAGGAADAPAAEAGPGAGSADTGERASAGGPSVEPDPASAEEALPERDSPAFLARAAEALARAANAAPEEVRGTTLPEAPDPFSETSADAPSEASAPDAGSEESPQASSGDAASDTEDASPPTGPTYVLRHYRVEEHVEEVDLAQRTLSIERTRAAAPADGGEASSRRAIGPDAPWSERLAYWTHPAAFVQGALEQGAQVEQQTVVGMDYQVVSFTPESGNEVRGYIDGDQRLARITTTVEAETGDTATVEVSWLDWEEREELVFPTVLIRKADGELVDVLVMQEVEAIAGG